VFCYTSAPKRNKIAPRWTGGESSRILGGWEGIPKNPPWLGPLEQHQNGAGLRLGFLDRLPHTSDLIVHGLVVKVGGSVGNEVGGDHLSFG
jgi:hypothetical protein